jgi:hypothetical protein
VQLQQFRKKKERRGPGKKADADADAEAEEGASKAAEESVPEPKSPVGLKLLAGEGSGGGGGSTPFEVRLDHFSVRLWVLSGLLLLLLFLDVAGCVMPVCQRLNAGSGEVPGRAVQWRGAWDRGVQLCGDCRCGARTGVSAGTGDG